MAHSKIGDVRLLMETETDVRLAEKIRRGVKYSPSDLPCYERLALEALRDEVLAARVDRAAKRREKSCSE